MNPSNRRARRSARGWVPLLLMGMATASGPGLAAPPVQNNPALLETRRAEVRRFIEQQQVSLRQQLECISTVRNLDELDRCQRGMPRMGAGMGGPHMGGWGMGNWGCTPW